MIATFRQINTSFLGKKVSPISYASDYIMDVSYILISKMTRSGFSTIAPIQVLLISSWRWVYLKRI